MTARANSALALSRQDAFGRAVAARLSASPGLQAHDIGERLRVARQAAVARHRELAVDRRPPLLIARWRVGLAGAGGGGSIGPDSFGWWQRALSAVPVLVLAAGMVFLHAYLNDMRASELADVDAALLTDDLPPTAYSDPGFLQFMRAHVRPADEGTN